MGPSFMEDNSTNGASAEESLTLLCDPDAEDGADATFTRVIQCMDAAEKSIEIHMFVWRNDTIGNEIGRAVLRAAKRGVKVKIKKDRGTIMYERIEMNRKSFFHTDLTFATRLKYGVFRPTFPNTFVRDDFQNDLGAEVFNQCSFQSARHFTFARAHHFPKLVVVPQLADVVEDAILSN